MAMFDPFYGVFDGGRRFARFLNRLTIIIEVLIIIGTFYRLFIIEDRSLGWLALAIPATALAVYLVNLVLRWICNLLIVFRYGTSDSEEITLRHEAKMSKRRARKARRMAKRNARKIARISPEDERRIEKIQENMTEEEIVEYQTQLMLHPEKYFKH